LQHLISPSTVLFWLHQTYHTKFTWKLKGHWFDTITCSKECGGWTDHYQWTWLLQMLATLTSLCSEAYIVPQKLFWGTWLTYIHKHWCALISAGNTFQDLPWLCETADNTECYIWRDIHITSINMVKFIDK
jgi:hypothetical protein